MTAIASQRARRTVQVPAWAVEATLILALGLAVLFLREVGLLEPDLTLPLYWDALGAPDLARSLD